MMPTHHPLPCLPRLALLAAALLLVVAAFPLPALAADNPKPVIKYLSPTVVSAGAKGPRLYVIGTGFGQDSLVQWDGVDRPTEYYSSTKLSIQLANDDVAYPATVTVTVFNPAPGGGLSNAKSFMVKYVPIVKSVRPAVVELEPATMQPKDGTSYWEIDKSRLNPPMTAAFGRALEVVCENNQPVILVLLSDTSKLSSTTRSAIYRLTSSAQGQVGSFDRITPISGPATGLAARSPTEFFYSSGRTITRVVAGSPPVVTSYTLPSSQPTIGGLDYVGGPEPYLLAISGDPRNHKVLKILLNPATGDFTGTGVTFLQINVPAGSPLASYTYTGVSLVPAWGPSREPVLYVTKEDGTAEPRDIAAIVDLRGTVIQTVIGDQNGILVDHTVWSSGLSSSYLNWANPQGIDYVGDCSACQCGPGRLFMITRDFWNKGPKYPINPPPGCIQGVKWNDLDRDGMWERTEPVMAGWPIILYKEYCGQWYKVDETLTDTDGSFSFCDLSTGSGDYRVAEGTKAGWVQSWPGSPGYHDFYYTKYTTVTGKDFGNYQSAPGTIEIRKEAAGCLAPPAGMVGWWAGDGTAVDLVGGNDGILLEGGGYTTGKVDEAFSLDGNDDLVYVPETAGGAPLDGFSALTLDAWVKPSQVGPGLRTIVSKYSYPQENGVSYWLGILGDGRIGFAVYTGSTATNWVGYYVETQNPQVSVGSFSHVAGVWEGGNLLSVYVDGARVAANPVETQGTPGNRIADTTTPVNIGRVEGYNGQPDFHFKGIIEEVEIFGRALSATEVKAISDAGSAGKCKHGAVTFPFSGTGGLGSFPLLVGGHKFFDNLAPGTYAVTEEVPPGWSLKTIECSDPTGGTTTSGPTAQISLAGGETVICTFVNEECSHNPCGSP
ncbi:MAG: hypothetical protein LUQ62_03280 [Methanomicrobiales archaeon]|nr:hypothetical protein [Methanomicrobiales archaeon]